MGDLGNKDVLSKNLKTYMELNNKTRKEICDTLGFKYTTFSDWLNAKKYPRIDKIEMLANYFGINKSDLIEDKSENTNEVDEKQKHINTVAAHLEDKNLTPKKLKLLQNYIDALFDEEEDNQ